MLNVSVFRNAISRMGENVAWYKAMPCNCYDPRTNHDAQRSCDRCVHGYIYRLQGTVRALVASQKQWAMNPELGWLKVSELSITTMPEDCRIGAFDKIVLLQRTALARERLTRGSDTMPHMMPVRVIEVAEGDTVFSPTSDYRVDLTARKIVWLSSGPSNVYAAEYEYRPEYWYAGANMREPRPVPPGNDAAMTPIQGTLTLNPPEG